MDKINSLNAFKDALNSYHPDATLTIHTNARSCSLASKLIVTTTPTTTPFLTPDDLQPGSHINAMGADAPAKQEISTTLLKKALIIVDDLDQAQHSGDISRPFESGLLSEKDIATDLGQLCNQPDSWSASVSID